jgi:plastocyanin
MKGKIVILVLALVFLLASGCAQKETEPVGPQDSNNSVPQADVTEQGQNAISGSGQEHIVRLEYYKVFRPAELDIKAGDTVSWWSQLRQGTYTLVSNDGLFPDKELAYSVPFSFTFNEPGTYSFTVKDIPEMKATVRVT